MIHRVIWVVVGSLLVGSTTGQDEHNRRYFDTFDNLKDGMQFEYVVVGGGGAGAAAAARLALAGASVLLVEAGGDPSVMSMIPGAAMSLLGSSLDWQYKTIPNNKSCLGSRGDQCRFARGKALGGSTAINYMIYTRGNRQDYDDINLPGWSWKDLKPYFLRYEGLQDLRLLPPSSIPYHNTTGTMRIEYFPDSGNDWHPRIIKSLMDLGIPYNPDVNARSQIGVSQVIGYVHEGLRMSTFRGFLSRSDVREKLVVAKYTLCTGIIIDEYNVARGITVAKANGLDKKTIHIYASKEVILSAGAIGSTQILLLSGIGPAEHLRSLGIPVRADLPVGENLNDHVLPLILVKVNPDAVVANLLPYDGTDAQAKEWYKAPSGRLASNGLTDVTTFLNTRCYDIEKRKLSNQSFCELPTLQLINAYIPQYLLPFIKLKFQKISNLKTYILDQIIDVNMKHPILVKSPVLLRPYSYGSIRLNSTDPFDTPAIFPNYLDDERDVEEMLRAIAIIEDLVKTPEYKKRGGAIVKLVLRGCPRYEDDHEKYWRCYMRHMTNSVYHAVGTAALGCVVDERLRVRGVRALRVADIGVLPQVPLGNTAAAAIAIGEKVSDLVREDNRGY